MGNFKKEIHDDRIVVDLNIDSPINKGMGEIFFEKMKKHHKRIAQIDAVTGEEETYSSLLRRCVRTALAMQSRGINTNSIISSCSNNSLDSIVPYISTQFIGAKFASLDQNLSSEDIIDYSKQVEPSMIFVASEALGLIEEAVEKNHLDTTQIVVFGKTDKYIQFSEFLQPIPEEDKFEPVVISNPYDTALIVFSSGVSGMPKGICLNHYLLLNHANILRTSGINPDVVLGFATLYWVSAILLWNTALIGGTKRIIVPTFQALEAWKVIDRYSPTWAFLAPTQMIALYSEKSPENLKRDSLADIFIGGGPMLREQVLEAKKAFPKARVGLCYGLTETGGFNVFFKPKNPQEIVNMDKYPLSCGCGMDGVLYKVVDIETEELLGPNQRGELRMKTPLQLHGYYNHDASEVWDSDGWLQTGDVVYYNEDKCFFVVDRIKEMLKFQSWHVPPASVEKVISSHPSIEHVVVIGVPHEIDGDHPMAVITLKDGHHGKIVPEDIVKYVEERVHDRQRLRGGVKIVDNMPLTPSGKPIRKVVKSMILEK